MQKITVAQSPKLVFNQGDIVEVEWKGKWYRAEITKKQGDLYTVHYEGYTHDFDESVEAFRLRSLNSSPEKSADTERKEKPAGTWTWKDGSGNVRTRAELQNIMLDHALWLQSNGQQGTRADLTNADLESVELTAVNLNFAQMPGVNLSKANLTAVFLKNANLSQAKLIETKMNALMESVDLSGASFNRAKISGTLNGADLRHIEVIASDFASVSLARANLSEAIIFDSNFSNVFLAAADLKKAKVFGGDWSDANLLEADVSGLYFEPTKPPDTRYFAGAKNLELITYGTSPDALIVLRNNFKQNGFDEAGRKITYAFKRRRNDLDKEQGAGNRVKYLSYYFNLMLFDWTVRYGLEPERALFLVIYVWLIFAVIYDLFIHFPGRSGIFLVKNRVRKNVNLTSAIRIRPRVTGVPRRRKFLWRWLRSEWRVFRISLFFSATRALHLGYGELDFGRWLQMLTKREYELRPKHWTRALAGWQSLISLYLIVMWILTEFSNPFE